MAATALRSTFCLPWRYLSTRSAFALVRHSGASLAALSWSISLHRCSRTAAGSTGCTPSSGCGVGDGSHVSSPAIPSEPSRPCSGRRRHTGLILCSITLVWIMKRVTGLWGIQVNSRTKCPQQLKCLISLCTNLVSILSPYSNRPLKPLTPLIGLTQSLLVFGK
jgi:hypothetical protein